MDTKTLQTPYPKGSDLDSLYKTLARIYGFEPKTEHVLFMTLKVLRDIRGALNLIAFLIVASAILAACSVLLNF
jgi:hypothetical protein